MHARLDELLSLRDGEPVSARVIEHLQGCEPCAAELRRLARLHASLRELPRDAGAGPGWPAVQQELARREQRVRLHRRQARYVAAASLCAVMLMIGVRFSDPLLQPGVGVDAASGPRVAAEQSQPTLAEMRQRSRELEALLAALPQRPAVGRADVGVPIGMLEERVQWLDHELSVAAAGQGATGAGQQALWRDRIETLDSLVRLRYVEAQRTSL